jgi:hypothetical protein
MEAVPALLVRRSSVIDKKTGAILDEMWWDAVLGLVRVDQGPHEDLKLVVLEIRSHFVDTVINENKTGSSIVPYNRFLFGTAPT